MPRLEDEEVMPKKYCVQKNVGSKKNLRSEKKFWSENNLGKIIGSKKNFDNFFSSCSFCDMGPSDP